MFKGTFRKRKKFTIKRASGLGSPRLLRDFCPYEPREDPVHRGKKYDVSLHLVRLCGVSGSKQCPIFHHAVEASPTGPKGFTSWFVTVSERGDAPSYTEKKRLVETVNKCMLMNLPELQLHPLFSV